MKTTLSCSQRASEMSTWWLQGVEHASNLIQELEMQGWLNDESYLETVFFTNFPHTSPISSISHVCHHLWKAGINKGLLTLRTVIQQTMLRSMFPQGIIFAMIINIAVTSLESKSARLHQGHTRRHQPSGLSATYEAHHHSRLPSGHMFTQQQALLYFAGIESRSTYCNGRQTITLTKICFCPQTKLKKNPFHFRNQHN